MESWLLVGSPERLFLLFGRRWAASEPGDATYTPIHLRRDVSCLGAYPLAETVSVASISTEGVQMMHYLGSRNALNSRESGVV